MGLCFDSWEDRGRFCDQESWGKRLSVRVTDHPFSAVVSSSSSSGPGGLAWTLLPEAHAQDPAMANGTLMAEGQVSLGFLFPKMTL